MDIWIWGLDSWVWGGFEDWGWKNGGDGGLIGETAEGWRERKVGRVEKGGVLGQTMLNAGFLGLVDDELLQFLLVGRRELGEVELAYGGRGGVHVDGT